MPDDDDFPINAVKGFYEKLVDKANETDVEN